MKENNVMQRLKYTEALQNVAELKQYIAKLESKVFIYVLHNCYISYFRMPKTLLMLN